MNNGMKLILARMETNPEEFQNPKNKWSALTDNYWEIFTDDERDTFKAKLREVQGDSFSEAVLKTLMDQDATTVTYKASGRYALSATEAALANKLNISLGDYAKIKTDMGKIK